MLKSTVRRALIAAAAAFLLAPCSAHAQNANRLNLAEIAQMQRVLEKQLERCLPAEMAQRVGSVTLRVLMNRDGTLASSPVMVSSKVNADSSLLIKAFTQCITPTNPLKFPAEKYAAWKVFKYSFSPPAH